MNADPDRTGEADREELYREIARLREEKEVLERELEDRGARKRRPFPWRNFLAWLLVALAFVTAVAAPPASWAHDYLLDTDSFVASVAPLIREEEVARAVSERAADTLMEELDVEARLRRVLPGEIDFISVPLAGGVRTLASRASETIVTSDQFYWVWERILRLGHSTAVSSIRGDGALEVKKEGDIVLDIGDLLVELKGRLVEAGLTFLERVPVPSDAGTVVLYTSEELGAVRGGVHLLESLNWILPVLAVLLLAAAVIVSTSRRRFLMISGIAAAVAMAVSLIALHYAENQLLSLVEAETNLAAAQVVWNRLLGNLVAVQAGILALGVVVAAGSAAAGPYRWAVWLRARTVCLFEAWRDRRQRGVVEAGPVGRFVEAHRMALLVGGLALILIILLLLPKVTAWAVIGSAIAFAVYLAAIELLRGGSAAEAAPPPFPDDGAAAGEEPPPGKRGGEDTGPE